jgi:hypothetical protein
LALPRGVGFAARVCRTCRLWDLSFDDMGVCGRV